MARFFDNKSEILIAQADVHEEQAVVHETTEHETSSHGGEHETPAYIFYIYGAIAIIIFLIFAFISTRKLKLRPGKIQNVFEYIVEMLYSIPVMVMGERGLKYAPFVSTFFIAIICMNVIGLIPGLKAATANPSITFGLSIVAFIAIQYYGFKENGFGYVKHFMGPVAALAPLIFIIELASELVRPLSLAMRLYGNIFGEEMVVHALSTQIHPLAAIIMLPLQILSVFLQSFVFTLLVSVYISMATEKEGH